jgi:hypothetical protein
MIVVLLFLPSGIAGLGKLLITWRTARGTTHNS